MTAPADVAPEVALRSQRRQAAVAWRLDHRTHPDRHWMWRAYTTGAIRGIGSLGPLTQAAIRAALADAERTVPFARVLCGIQPAGFKVPDGCRLPVRHKVLHEVIHEGRPYRFTFVDGGT